MNALAAIELLADEEHVIHPRGQHPLGLPGTATAVGKGIDGHRQSEPVAEIVATALDVGVEIVVRFEFHRGMGERVRADLVAVEALDLLQSHHRRRRKFLPAIQLRQQIVRNSVLLGLRPHLEKVGQALSEPAVHRSGKAFDAKGRDQLARRPADEVLGKDVQRRKAGLHAFRDEVSVGPKAVPGEDRDRRRGEIAVSVVEGQDQLWLAGPVPGARQW